MHDSDQELELRRIEFLRMYRDGKISKKTLVDEISLLLAEEVEDIDVYTENLIKDIELDARPKKGTFRF